MSIGRHRQVGSSCLESNFSYSWLPDYPGSVSEQASSGSTVAHSRRNATQHGVTALKSQRRGGSSSSSSKAKRNERKQSKKNSKRTKKELQNNWKKELKKELEKTLLKSWTKRTELNRTDWRRRRRGDELSIRNYDKIQCDVCAPGDNANETPRAGIKIDELAHTHTLEHTHSLTHSLAVPLAVKLLRCFQWKKCCSSQKGYCSK